MFRRIAIAASILAFATFIGGAAQGRTAQPNTVIVPSGQINCTMGAGTTTFTPALTFPGQSGVFGVTGAGAVIGCSGNAGSPVLFATLQQTLQNLGPRSCAAAGTVAKYNAAQLTIRWHSVASDNGQVGVFTSKSTMLQTITTVGTTITAVWKNLTGAFAGKTITVKGTITVPNSAALNAACTTTTGTPLRGYGSTQGTVTIP